MGARFTGRCQCGAVTAEIAGACIQTRQCWCRQCQKVAGGFATANAIFSTSDVTVTGALATHAYVAASGNTLSQHRCASCGTPVMAQSSARPHFRVFRIGFLDEGHGLAPEMAIWTDEAPAWAVIDPALQTYPQQPPAPPPKD